ncbi:hypothetical protein LTR56_024813 [Elasticomyces elasticus]|nr:hypothetical protein LTR56_024813 [Elasticomyces elasticus]KAK3621794.1 hypothetical protein LTR22_025057 [Elasticomyces elasticus]KAK4906629.1 hypothetical protein LTR49_024242 [Elasticomyces elasticus]
MFPGAVISALLPLSSSLITAASKDVPQVESTSGLIIGHGAPNGIDTFEFLDIKYGKPPVRKLRFATPQRHAPVTGTVYNASSWNADCPANIPPETTFPKFTGNGFAM